jgi:hypothetical protein
MVGARGRPLPWLRSAAALLFVSLLSACVPATSDLLFRQDTRLRFATPQPRHEVKLPVRLTWEIKDFRVVEPASEPPRRDAGYFAVFVDRVPIRPGQTLEAVAKDDQACLKSPTCPDRTYLEQRQVYTTTATSLTLAQVYPFAHTHDRLQLHTATVVLMDASGHRIGESAWEIQFRLRQKVFR